MERYGVVDMGTNSARLMIAQVDAGRVVSVYKTLRTIRMGEGMVGCCQIMPAAMERARDALREYQTISKQKGAGRHFFCFATSAVREAKNRQEFIDYIKRECGVVIEIISGGQEAALGFAGSVTGYGGMLDIGGGSTEVMQGSLNDVWFQHSFQVGTVRMLQMFPKGDEADQQAFLLAHKTAREVLAGIPEADGIEYTGIGGTATALASIDLGIREYDASRVQGHTMDYSRVEEICAMLKAHTKQERGRLTGLPEGKADVIVFGAIIMMEFLNAVRASRIVVSDRDNQEGYLALKLGLI